MIFMQKLLKILVDATYGYMIKYVWEFWRKEGYILN